MSRNGGAQGTDKKIPAKLRIVERRDGFVSKWEPAGRNLRGADMAR